MTQLRHLMLLLLLVVATGATAQTRIHFRDIRVVEKGDTLRGADVTMELRGAEGTERGGLFSAGDVSVQAKARVTSHNVRRSSVKDGAVNLVMEVDMHAGRDKDNKRIEKIFYLDQARTSAVVQRFTFKDGITMRGITLLFNCAIE